MVTQQQIDRLTEIQDEIERLAEEAMRIVRFCGDRTEIERSKGYWYAHILGALKKETAFLGGSMFTMESTIGHLEGQVEGDEDECEDDLVEDRRLD